MFRKIFCEHKNLCISLLNALLPIGTDEQIEEIEYLDPNMFPEYINEKHSIVDVRCRDQKGRQYIALTSLRHLVKSMAIKVSYSFRPNSLAMVDLPTRHAPFISSAVSPWLSCFQASKVWYNLRSKTIIHSSL